MQRAIVFYQMLVELEKMYNEGLISPVKYRANVDRVYALAEDADVVDKLVKLVHLEIEEV